MSFLWLAAVTGLVVGLHRVGFGLDYVNASLGAVQVFKDGGYNPFSVFGGNAPYPPYLFTLLGPFAYSEAGALVSLVLNVVAPVVLVRALGGPREAGLLLVLFPQSVANLALNNPQFIALFGFALLVWATRRGAPRWAGIAAGVGFILMTLKPNQLVLAPAVLALRNRGTFAVACAVAGAALGLSFLAYGFWVPIWLDYMLAVPMASADFDSLLLTLTRLGMPADGMLLVQAAVLLDSLRYMWRWRTHQDPRLSWVVALAAANVIGVHANIISTLPLLAVTVSLIPLRWSLVLALVAWTYAVAFYVVTGQFVIGFYGLTPVVCVIAAAVAVRKTGVKL